MQVAHAYVRDTAKYPELVTSSWTVLRPGTVAGDASWKVGASDSPSLGITSDVPTPKLLYLSRRVSKSLSL